VTGLYGGAFDPPHLGHVAVARAAKERFGLDRLVVLVNADPGHKSVHAPAGVRLELARAAFPDDEVRLDSHAFTIDMLRDCNWDDPLFVIGADEFCNFLAWKEPDEVLELARLAVAERPGYPRERLEEMLTRLRRPERVEIFAIEPHPHASRELRAQALEGGAVDELVPAAVAELIRERGLYRR
jgi:nicotinate-nucleotide adenylyltransferase